MVNKISELKHHNTKLTNDNYEVISEKNKLNIESRKR